MRTAGSTKSISAQALRRLYIQKRLSTADIAELYGCSSSKINYWLQRYGIQKRTISDALYVSHNPEGDPFINPRIDMKSDLFLAGLGIGLYWGEGNKKNLTSVRLGNTDYRLVRTFVRFLLTVFRVPIKKFRFGLQVFSDMRPEKALAFWVAALRPVGVVRGQFQKVVVTPARSIGTYREKSQDGVLTVYCSNVKLKRLLDSILARYEV